MPIDLDAVIRLQIAEAERASAEMPEWARNNRDAETIAVEPRCSVCGIPIAEHPDNDLCAVSAHGEPQETCDWCLLPRTTHHGGPDDDRCPNRAGTHWSQRLHGEPQEGKR
jgi:hypothetical protein